MKPILSVVAMLSAAALAASILPDAMTLRGPFSANAPLSTDSVDVKGAKYAAKAMLSRRINQGSKSSTIVENADSSFTIPAADTDALYILSTRVRADRYYNGNLAVECTQPFAIMVGGKQESVKESVEDQPTAASKKSQKLTLDPDVTYDIEVRVLARAGKPARVKIGFDADSDSEEVALLVGNTLKRRYLLADSDQGQRAVSTSVSPDGKYAIVKYQNRTAKQDVVRRAEIVDTKSLAYLADVPVNASWLPSGHTLYTTAKEGDAYSVSTIAVPSMASKVIHRDVPVGDFDWAPDTTFIIYASTQAPDPTNSAFRRYASPDDRIEGNRNRYGLRRYTFATGLEEDLTFGTKNVSMNSISSDSRKLLCMVQRETPSKYPFYEIDLLQLNLATMKVDTLLAANPYITNAVYSPKADKVFVVGSPRAFGDKGLKSGNHPIPNDFDAQGYILDVATGSVEAVTRDFDPSVSGPIEWNAADGRVYFRGLDGFNVGVFALDPATGVIDRLPVDMQNVSNFSIGRDEARWLSYTGQGDDYAGRASMLNLLTRRTTLLADPFAKYLDKIELGPTTEWRFTTSDGTTIDGTMTLPPDFDPAKKYPLIVYYYGGTSPSQHGLTHPYVPQLYASRGYVVYVLNPSGTYGYGQEFSARHVNAWGQRTADDIIEGVKEFCKAHPFVDAKKIGCMGASYGGFMTQYLQTRTDIFAAAVSHAGISNVTSYWGEGYWGYTYNSVAAAESYPWTNPELFTKQGSLFNADKIHTPLLLIHGTADTNVPIGESIQLFNALRILGRDVEFISVEGENHTSGSFPFEKRQIWHDTILAWFAKYLKDDPRWWNKMYPDPNL